MAIANANEVLKAIDKMEMTDKLSAAKAKRLSAVPMPTSCW